MALKNNSLLTTDQVIGGDGVLSPRALRRDTKPIRADAGQGTTIEADDSRELVGDIQRVAERETFYVKKMPDDAFVDPGVTGISPGDYHIWHKDVDHPGYNWMTATNFEVRHHVKGGAGKAYSKIITTWEKSPSSNTYRVSMASASVGYPEWFNRQKIGGQHFRLSKGSSPIIMPAPQIVMRIEYPRVKMSEAEISAWEDRAGFVDMDIGGEYKAIRRKPKHYWRLHGFEADELYGNPEGDECWYRLTIILIGDPYRGHMHWFPKYSQHRLGGYVVESPPPGSVYPILDTHLTQMLLPPGQQPGNWLYNTYSMYPKFPLFGLLRLGEDPAGPTP